MKDISTLVARRDIGKGKELTADYALWEADENYISKWECQCGSVLCRHKVTGKDWRNPELQERYNKHFSKLINKRIEKFKQDKSFDLILPRNNLYKRPSNILALIVRQFFNIR